jgi:hypothetical protein
MVDHPGHICFKLKRLLVCKQLFSCIPNILRACVVVNGVKTFAKASEKGRRKECLGIFGAADDTSI